MKQLQITEEQRQKGIKSRKENLAPIFELRKLTKRKSILENRAAAIRSEQKTLQQQINKILVELGAISSSDAVSDAVPVIGRANWHVRICKLLEENPQGLRLTDIARKYEKPASYFQNVLGQMSMKGLIKRNADKIWTNITE